MSVINNNLLLTPEGYQISRSVRLRSSASAYLSRAITTTSSLTTFTFSAWVKRGNLSGAASFNLIGNSTNAAGEVLDFYNDTLRWSSYNVGNVISTQVFRDSSAWYHIVVVLDTTNATSSSRLRMYVNGVQITTFSTATYPALNSSCQRVNTSGITNYLGGTVAATAPSYFDGYLTEVNFIDGQALTPSSFGETDAVTGVWKPKKYAGTYGTNGFYLNFSDNSSNTATTIGKDNSGNGNNWTPNNISVTAGATYDSMIDVPTLYADGGNGRGNYCVINPLLKGGNLTIAAANLNINSTGAWTTAYGTFLIPTTGKWYWEVTAGGVNTNPGIVSAASNLAGNLSTYPADTLVSYTYYGSSGNKLTGPGNTSAAYGASFTTNDVIGIAFDADAGTLTFYKNNTSQGTAFSSLTAQYVPVFGVYDSGVQAVNFGQRPFSYTPPTGFKALNTQNLPEATIKKGGSYFNTVLYTGNAGSQSITGVGFQPDLVWGKTRSIGGNNRLHDSARGSDNTLSSNLTDAEVSGNGLVSFDADGFTMDSGTNINQAYAYVAWNWKESASAGFDIVTYTGTSATRTVDHSLGVKPAMIIVKSRNAPSGGYANWNVTHQSLNMSNQGLYLNGTQAAFTDTDQWGNTQPTSSVFTVGANSASNNSLYTYVAYLFAEVAGFSKFGSYTGNGSADGPFVYLGFKPRFIMIKSSTTAQDWKIIDTARNTYNSSNSLLAANVSSAEDTNAAYAFDILSNGFKPRNTFGYANTSGATYIYAAFAENPFRNSLAR